MLLSFLLTNKIDNNKLELTLKSILNQTNDQYEIIFIDDQINFNESEILNTYFHNFPDKIRIITNSNQVGVSESWNIGLNYSKAQYVYFLQVGDIIEPNMVQEIGQLVDKNDIDVIEFIIQYSNTRDHFSSNRLKSNCLYNPERDKNVFALIHHSLFNKVFKRDFLIKNNINFRSRARYDLLFIYCTLATCKTLFTSDKFLATIEINPILSFNVFDFLRQWPHIFNYYRRLELLKVLIYELEYAYVRFHLYTFLKVVKPTKNKKLITKAIEIVKVKVRHFPNWQNNNYFITLKDDRFYKEVSNLDKYLYEYKSIY